jgi:phosphate transport system substrate-binding protein
VRQLGYITALLAPPLLAAFAGCGPANGQAARPATVIRVEGSDTMVNIAQAWAERYHGDRPTISVQVLGGGSGVGIASLTDGNCDLADSSRDVSPKEVLAIRAKRGEEPKEHIVGYDALAVYVHPDNPLDSISLDELAEIFGDGGQTVRWSQLGVDYRSHGRETIVRVGRQNSSGTYAYFREAVLGKKRDFKLGSIDRSGSKDVVALISRTPLALGYSGMGYATSGVKMLRVARHRGERGIAPTVENACNRSYPLTRPLQIYTVGRLPDAVTQYLEWILSPEGQKIVVQLGYVPARRSDKRL